MHPFQMQKYAFRAGGSKKETNDKKQKNTGIVPRIRAHIESQDCFRFGRMLAIAAQNDT